MTLPKADVEAVLEAILFVASAPMPADRLIEVFDEADRATASEALECVLERYRGSAEQGIVAETVGGGVRLVTRPDLHPYLKRFFQVTESSRLSMAALETLAIVAYRQPVTAPEVQDLRGVSSSGVLKTLLERHLVRITGRKQVVGKPYLYGTTRQFLLHFGLGSLADLPPLEEFEEALGLDDGGAGGGVDREEEILRANAALDDLEDRVNVDDEEVG